MEISGSYPVGGLRPSAQFLWQDNFEFLISTPVRTIKSLEDSGVLADGVIHWKSKTRNKKRRQISLSFVSTFSCFSSTTSNFYYIFNIFHIFWLNNTLTLLLCVVMWDWNSAALTVAGLWLIRHILLIITAIVTYILPANAVRRWNLSMDCTAL